MKSVWVLAQVSVGSEGVEWIRLLGFTNPVGRGGVLDLCMGLGCGGGCGEYVGGLDQGLQGWVVLCLCEL